MILVSTHSRPKAAVQIQRAAIYQTLFQHTAARRRLAYLRHDEGAYRVSTHSRPKAADSATIAWSVTRRFQHTAARRRLQAWMWCKISYGCFNTQPPEGGCLKHTVVCKLSCCFNTQPPEGGWIRRLAANPAHLVSTHSRPKAADQLRVHMGAAISFNTQPPEGGWSRHEREDRLGRFQHTAARRRLFYLDEAFIFPFKFQHTAARRRLSPSAIKRFCSGLFQHTAARRRLDCRLGMDKKSIRFNTQPPEGGCG